MNRVKILTTAFTYLLVFGIYLAFFAYPVHPATANSSAYHEVESKKYSEFPSVFYRVYVRGSTTPGILLVATVRTPFLPHSTYSRILRAMEGVIENETKERYRADIDLQYVDEVDAQIANRTVVMDYYTVHLKYQFNNFFNPTVVKLYFGAFFCNERYESVIVAYVVPPVFEGDFSGVMGSIGC